MADTPRSKVRTLLRAIGRAWMYGGRPAYPPPSAADVAQAARASWYVWRGVGGYEWRAVCGCVSEHGKASSADDAETISQSVAMRLRRYAIQ